jgi:hypothetical protein
VFLAASCHCNESLTKGIYNLQKLNELQSHVDAMRSRCDDAEAQLQLTNEASKNLLERAGSLRRER